MEPGSGVTETKNPQDPEVLNPPPPRLKAVAQGKGANGCKSALGQQVKPPLPTSPSQVHLYNLSDMRLWKRKASQCMVKDPSAAEVVAGS